MKNFTRSLIATSVVVMVAFNAFSQDVFKTANVGIGTLNPAQKLDVSGNVKFSGALMPNNLPGTAGNLLLSAGVGIAPTWLANGANGTILTISGGVPTWTTPGAALSSAWLLTGNTISATYGTNYIGTTGSLPFEFYVNNAYAGVLDPVRYSVYFGQGAGGDSTNASYANANGAQNIAIGWEALTSVTATVSNNVALGYDALHFYHGTAGPNNAIGASALYNATTGGFNDAFGYGSGFNITTGTYNLSEGYEAAYYNQTGTYNTAVGDSAMYGTALYTGAIGNTAVGVSALSSVNSSSLYNTAVGYEAARHITTGTYNTSIGYRANYSTQTAYGNVAVGNNALYANTYSGNTAVGTGALQNNNAGGPYVSAYVGGPNTAVGDSAMYNNVYGVQNVAVGWAALAAAGHTSLAANDTSVGNSAIGYGSMAAMTDGLYNTTLGVFTMNSAPNASYCVAIGFSAMRYNNGSARIAGDIAIGQDALDGTGAGFTGNYDIAIGSGAMQQTSGSASYDIAIGIGAAYSNGALTNGDYDVALGYYTNVGTTQSYNTAIGYEAAATAGTTVATGSTSLGAGASASASNATAIGANASASTANTIILGQTATATSVGIGTTAPARLLEVGGTANTLRIDGLQLGATYNSGSTTSSSNILYTNNVTGDVYSLPNGTSGYVLTISSGVPTWAAGSALTASLPLSITAGNITLSGINGGVAYGTGSSVAFTAGPTGDVLEGQGAGNAPIWTTLATLAGSGDNWGTQVAVTDSSNDAGSPERTLTGNGVTPLKIAQNGATSGDVLVWNGSTWIPSSANSSLTTANILNGGGSSTVVVTNGTGQVVNSALGNVSVDVKGAAGQVLYGTGASTSAVFTTSGSAGQVLELTAGVPTWTTLAAGSGWNLTGNTGTTPGTNFIGTLDDNGLEFEVNGHNAGSLDALNNYYTAANVYLGGASTSAPVLNGAGNNDAGDNNVAIGLSAMASTGGPSWQSSVSFNTGVSYISGNVAVGVYALSSAVYGGGNVALGAWSQRYFNYPTTATTTGNTAAGAYSLYSNSTGTYNTAIGYYSMYGSGSATAYGNFNTALGYNSLYSASAGIASNTAVGSNALLNASANRNTAVGDSALYSNTSGANNTALGYQANVTGNPTNATVLGYQATNSVSNSVTLGNSSVSSLYLPGYTNVGDILYTSLGTGLVAGLTPGAAGTVLESQGAGSPPTWLSVAGVNSVTGTPPIYSTGGSTPVISVQGNLLGTDKGGVLYSTGSGNPAVFTTTGTANYVLQSNGTAAPSWVSAPAAANAWLLTGNTISTTYGTNFLGTLNTVTQVPLEFKVSNSYAGLLDANASNIYFGRGTGGDSTVLNTVAGQNVAIGWEAFAKLPSTTAVSDVTAIGADALHNNVASNNDGVGAFALYNNTSGTPNTAYGYAAGFNITTGSNNFAAGYNSMYNQTTGTLNVAVGDSAMYGAPSGASGGAYVSTANTAMGVNALGALAGTATTGSYNTAVGYESSRNITTGNYNVGVGYQAGYSNATGYGNVAMGYNSLKLNTASDNVAVGANSSLNTTGAGNTAVGDSALYTNTTGTYNTAIGYQANVTGNPTNATVIGYQATNSVSNSVTLGNSSTTLYLPGYTAVGDILYTGTLGGGQVAALTPGASGSVLESQGAGNPPTWLPVAGANSVSGTPPIYVTGPSTTPTVNIQGLPSGSDAGGVLYSTGAGTSALFNSTGTSGYILESQGTSAPIWVTPSVSSLAWTLTGNSISAGQFLGTTDPQPLTFRLNNVFAGDISGVTSGSGESVVLGYGANSEGGTTTEGPGGDVILGYEAAYNNSGSGNMTAVGANALYSQAAGATAAGVVAVGYSSQYYATANMGNNTSVGSYSLYSNSTGANETALGYNSMYGNGTGTGYFGSSNTAIGYQSLYGGAGTQGGLSNTAVGSNALYNNTNNGTVGIGGNRNTAIGDSALATNTTGEGNTALGYDADVSINNLTNATVIGYKASAPGSNTITLGNSNVTSLYLPGYTATGDLLYTSAASGLVSELAPSATLGYVLTSAGAGAAPTWSSVTGATSVAGTPPIYITGTATAPVVNIQGLPGGTDAGGVLYSTGAGNSALFTSTPSGAGLVLTSAVTGGAPTWQAAPSASNSWLIAGNSTTTPGTNYIGTSSTQALEFKVDAVPSGWIDYAGNINTYYGYGTGGGITSSSAGGDYGTSNVAVGVDAMGNIPSGAGVTATEAIGAYAMDFATAATSNTAFGAYSQYYNSGSLSVSVGAYSLYSNTAGGDETALGYQSMYGTGASGAMGSNNTGVGYRSLYSITTGGANTAVGSNALLNTTASANTAIGDSALASNTTGKWNTAVGYQALTAPLTTGGNYNTALGYNANISSGTLSNATAIGANAYAAQSNSMVLGSISGVNGASANTNVGIGTNVPATDAGLTIKTLHIETQVASIATAVVDTNNTTGAALTGTDVAGYVSFTVPASGGGIKSQVKITFANAYTTPPTVIITAGNAATGNIIGTYLPYVSNISTTGFSISFAGAPAASAGLQFNYFVIESQ